MVSRDGPTCVRGNMTISRNDRNYGWGTDTASSRKRSINNGRAPRDGVCAKEKSSKWVISNLPDKVDSFIWGRYVGFSSRIKRGYKGDARSVGTVNTIMGVLFSKIFFFSWRYMVES